MKELNFFIFLIFNTFLCGQGNITNNQVVKKSEVTKVNSNTQTNVVNLTTQGTGKTYEEAKNNALRSAIEQAFGVFISSNSEILNDSIVKDEIVSVTSGNIEKYEVLTQIQISDLQYLVSIKSTVSIYNLTKYCVSKGVEIEFNGSLFAENIKLQKLNEDAEFKSVIDLCKISKSLLNSAIDFTIHTTTPTQVKGTNDLFQIKYEVNCVPNIKYDDFISFFSKTLTGLSMNEYEANEYIQINKTIYSFLIYDNNKPITTRKYVNGRIEINQTYSSFPIILRDIRSVIALQNFFIRSNGALINFNIINDVETIYGTGLLDSWSFNEGKLSFPNFYFTGGTYGKFIPSSSLYFCFINNSQIIENYFRIPEEMKLLITQSKMNSGCGSFPTEKLEDFRVSDYKPIQFGSLNFMDPLNFRHSITRNYTLDQLSNINSIKIERTIMN